MKWPSVTNCYLIYLSSKVKAMKKISFRNFSLLGLALMGVSALTAAFIPSKADTSKDRTPGNGKQVNSTAGGGVTVIFTATGGNRSYTQTGAGDLSATSANDDGTLTSQRSWSTGGGTTALAQENLDVVHND